MFRKLNVKIIAIICGTTLLVLAGFFIKETYYSDNKCPTSMTTVGGKQNPCQCTQRIER